MKYFSLAAHQNHALAQFELGRYYLHLPKSINKAVYYLYLSAEQGNNDASFILGVIYSEGKDVRRNMDKAIHYYKEASSINHSEAKNNLAMIYKNGFFVEKNLWYAIELLKEAVRLNDKLSMYNLSHLYFFENGVDSNLDIIIDLLLRSSLMPSFELLCIVLVKKYKTITQEIIIYEINSREYFNLRYKQVLKLFIYLCIKRDNLECRINYENHYNQLKNKDFMYDDDFKFLPSYLLMKDHEKENKLKNKNLKNIDESFYEGFGISLD